MKFWLPSSSSYSSGKKVRAQIFMSSYTSHSLLVLFFAPYTQIQHSLWHKRRINTQTMFLSMRAAGAWRLKNMCIWGSKATATNIFHIYAYIYIHTHATVTFCTVSWAEMFCLCMYIHIHPCIHEQKQTEILCLCTYTHATSIKYTCLCTSCEYKCLCTCGKHSLYNHLWWCNVVVV